MFELSTVLGTYGLLEDEELHSGIIRERTRHSHDKNECLKAEENWPKALKQKGLKQTDLNHWLILQGTAYGIYKNSCILSSLSTRWDISCGTVTTNVPVSCRLNYR